MHGTEDASFYGDGALTASNAGYEMMKQWLERSEDVVEVQRGDILEGTIVRVSPTEIIVDVGCKADGVVPQREIEHMSPDDLAHICVGDCVPVYVLNPEDKDGNIVLSITRASAQRDWRIAESLFQSGEIFSGRVAGCNRGGLIVNIGRLRGFVPASQLTPSLAGNSGDESLRDDDNRWAHLLGQELRLKVIELDRHRNRLILSEKAAAREWRRMAKQHLLEQLEVGQIRQGIVTSLCEFGAFVDLGGADGLIHLSELSWNRVEHASEVLHVGQKVQVYVLEVDRARQRIGLSLRRLAPEPWEEIFKRYVVGQIVTGTITKIVNFGAFARIDDQVEGLIHISELSEARINHPHEVVKEGDTVKLKIIRIDAEQRRIGLSLKQAAEDDDFDWREELADSLHEGEGSVEAN